jgi:hypothetical protein
MTAVRSVLGGAGGHACAAWVPADGPSASWNLLLRLSVSPAGQGSTPSCRPRAPEDQTLIGSLNDAQHGHDGPTRSSQPSRAGGS